MQFSNKIPKRAYFHTLKLFTIICLSISILGISCKKRLEVTAPVFNLNQVTVYNSDESAASVLTGIYAKMSDGDLWSLSLFAGLSADELKLYNGVAPTAYLAYYRNALTSSNISGGGSNDFWNILYPYIFYSNAAIQGLNASASLTPAVKQQLLGEAKFIRAFCYFYLVNLYGDVPYTESIDFRVNSALTRAPKADVWNNIITDLKDAQSFLNTSFLDAKVVNETTERVRPTKWAATALLAKAYLYTGAYADAEAQAASIIENTGQFGLTALDDVFLKNSMEAIWQLQPVNYGQNTKDAIAFVIPSTGFNSDHPVYLNEILINSFELGDLRRTKWIDSIVIGGKVFYYSYKYHVNEPYQAVSEYDMVFRLAEQYLIRAEARIKQAGKINEGITDLNVLRARSRAVISVTTPDPLPALSVNLSKENALSAVEHERQVELFTEWGHRWLDLKRTNRVNDVMTIVTPLKGGIWNTNWQLYPIPIGDLQKNQNLKQNEGYN